MNSSRLSQFCDRALEAGWLLGVTITPVFFDVYSSRVFEPDKLTTLRALATIMAALWLTRMLDGWLRHEERESFTWRTPMVLPALVLMGVYLISSIFSLVPATSILGSYQRLQGAYSLFGYLVIFFAILHGLRSREQLSRLLTVLILNSLPISLYGIVQHQGADPLPWAGDVQTRVASNMGNAIFVAAYLIMIVPLTVARIVESFRDILGRAESRFGDVLRAAGYIFILAVQMLTIWYSQSRGPWLGIVAAGFLFPYLALIMLQRQALAEGTAGNLTSDLLRGVGFGLAALVGAGLLAGAGILIFSRDTGVIVGGLLAVLAFGAAWLYFVVEHKGWRWLWISWGTVGLTIAAFLLVMNIPGPIQDRVKQIPSISRLATITELDTGTGKVRTLIWQGTMELITPHEPLKYPDGRVDAYNSIRLLIGYGPESMYVSYNNFYPPELGHYESRTASPDRSHNETLDSVAVTGVLGLLAYLFTFGSVFYWGFRWLGLLQNRRQFFIYVGLDVFFAALLTFIGWKLEGLYLIGVGIPLGIMIGTVVYLTLAGFRRAMLDVQVAAPGEFVSHPHMLLIVAILAAVLGHLVEINFGIAIASTRTTFWAFAGLMVVLGLRWVAGEGEPETAPVVRPVVTEEAPVGEMNRRRRRREGVESPVRQPQRPVSVYAWLAPVAVVSLVATFLLNTLAFDFVNNPQQLADAGMVLWNSLSVRIANGAPLISYGSLLIFTFTWLLFGVIGLSEMEREGLFDEARGKRWVLSIAIYTVITLVGWMLFSMMLAQFQVDLRTSSNQQPTTQEDVYKLLLGIAERLSNVLGYYYNLIFLTVIAVAAILVWADKERAEDWGHLGAMVAIVPLLVVAGLAVRYGCYDLIRADIIFKQGEAYANTSEATQKMAAIRHYEKAIEYASKEDYYFLFRGKAYLEMAQLLTDQAARDEILVKTEAVLLEARVLNPLNTDHSANLGRFYRSWAAQTMDASLRQERLLKSEENYKLALMLSPHNAILWNELSILYAFDLKDMVKYEETIAQSEALDSEFDQTWMLMGDIKSSSGDLDGAITAYSRALEISGGSCTVRRVLGTLQAQQAQAKGAELQALQMQALTETVPLTLTDLISVTQIEMLTRWQGSVTTMYTATQECAGSSEEWEVYRVLAIGLANSGQIPEALQAATRAISLAPEDQKPAIQEFLDQLNAQIQPEIITPSDATPVPATQP